MSEITTDITSEGRYGQELATADEIAQSFALWSDLETDIRPGYQYDPGLLWKLAA